jgi:large subunit ribosomal protein L19
MRVQAIQEIEKKVAVSDVSRFPSFRSGDTLRIVVKVKESEKVRLQAFEGVCIRRRGEGNSKTFTVRKISFGNVSAVRTFFFHSPLLDSIEVLKKGKVRQSRIYYILQRKGKSSRIASR